MTPWPNPDPDAWDDDDGIQSSVTTVMSQMHFQVTTNASLPGGATYLSGDDAPAIMLWKEATSSFERRSVDWVSKSGSVATIMLTAAPTATIEAGDRISPYTDQADTVISAVTAYFDSLGPGELFDLTTRPVGSRGARFPKPTEQYPVRAGQSVVSRVTEALGAVAPDAHLAYCSKNEPDLADEIIDGPNQLTLGNVTLLPLE